MLEIQRWRDSARFDETDRAILTLAERLTLEPWNAQANDLDVLRRLGYSDLQLLNVTLLCAYRHYATRVADGTGIELDPVLQADDSILTAYSYEQTAEGPDPGKRGTDLQPATDAQPIGPWIATAPREPLSPTAKETLARWKTRLGFVPGFLEALQLNPEALCAIGVQIETVLFGEDELTSRQRELIATSVASAARCRYLESAFERVPASTDEGERAIARFADRLTLEPWRIDESDIETLRERGHSDGAVLDVIVEVAALNGLARIVEGLGVPSGPAWPWHSPAVGEET